MFFDKHFFSTNCFWTNFFGSNYFLTKFFFTNYIWPNCFLDQNFLTYFGDCHLCEQNFLRPKFFLVPNFFLVKRFLTKISLDKFLNQIKFFSSTLNKPKLCANCLSRGKPLLNPSLYFFTWRKGFELFWYLYLC